MDFSQLYLEAKAFNDGSIIAAGVGGICKLKSEKCFPPTRRREVYGCGEGIVCR